MAISLCKTYIFWFQYGPVEERRASSTEQVGFMRLATPFFLYVDGHTFRTPFSSFSLCIIHLRVLARLSCVALAYDASQSLTTLLETCVIHTASVIYT